MLGSKIVSENMLYYREGVLLHAVQLAAFKVVCKKCPVSQHLNMAWIHKAL